MQVIIGSIFWMLSRIEGFTKRSRELFAPSFHEGSVSNDILSSAYPRKAVGSK